MASVVTGTPGASRCPFPERYESCQVARYCGLLEARWAADQHRIWRLTDALSLLHSEIARAMRRSAVWKHLDA